MKHFGLAITADPTGLGLNWELIIFVAEFLLVFFYGAHKYNKLRKHFLMYYKEY